MFLFGNFLLKLITHASNKIETVCGNLAKFKLGYVYDP